MRHLVPVNKGAPEKVLIAVLLRERTSVSKGWIAQRLAMGYTGAVSRLTGDLPSRFREHEKATGFGRNAKIRDLTPKDTSTSKNNRCQNNYWQSGTESYFRDK